MSRILSEGQGGVVRWGRRDYLEPEPQAALLAVLRVDARPACRTTVVWQQKWSYLRPLVLQ